MVQQQGVQTLKRKQQSQKISISPLYFLLAVLSIAVLILGYNLKSLSKAIQESHHQQQQEVPVVPGDDNKNAKTLADDAAKLAAVKRAALEKINGKQETENQGATTKNDGSGVPQYHIIFSTGCSAFQDWQSYIFFFHAAKVLKRTSPPKSGMANTEVTRVASGCGSDADAEAMQALHREQIKIMNPNFHLHITPDFSTVHGSTKPYKYFNKPYGTKHWMEHVLGYTKDETTGKPNDNPQHDNDIVILMDPDQIILRPFTNDFSQHPEQWRTRQSLPLWDKVVRGQPFAQQYGFHNQWYQKTDITKIAKPDELPSPLETMNDRMRNENFSAGPPYIAVGADMYQISDKWAEFAVPTHAQYPFLLAEMFAMCLAAAHLNLPHQITQSFMVSDVGTGGLEGWKYGIDQYSGTDMCEEGKIPEEKLPNVLHYCQRYWLGKWFIGKYKLPKDFISCESPLLKVPPKDVALQYDFAVAPTGEIKKLNKDHVKRNAWMLCRFIPALNEAARFYKETHCGKDGKPPANFEETLVFHKNMEVEAIH
ncbi:expressed unknown protein [Seminavis robusta]|uniref:Uncharacterized protein n=1 Tax=Seminavis robusta TaxID=568900 RepID=A0A9N8HYQ7_9STRA|nr:expressed unknown protein [Seminavis robusta]|eukprot:Sro2965_g341080.1 n/a (538) ;mRNA; f:2801-4716